MHLIELTDVSFEYLDQLVLEKINLKIKTGESIALIGANGCGKSTLLKIINGILFPTQGAYYYNKEKISETHLKDPIRRRTFHQKIGFLFQNPDVQLFCSHVWEEIAFGPRQMGLLEKEVIQRVDDCLSLLDIKSLSHREPYKLSEGEKKKVALAAVLSLNPEVLVLDEPMDGLDPRSKRSLKELLISLNKAGKTIISATHDYEYVKGIFSRAIVISEKHQIVRDDSYADVMNDTTFLVKHNLK